MLTALEALMDGCHRVGRLLPEVQKCRLKRQNRPTRHKSAGRFKNNSPSSS